MGILDKCLHSYTRWPESGAEQVVVCHAPVAHHVPILEIREHLDSYSDLREGKLYSAKLLY